MKFAKYLESESIPEWRKAYIDYKGLKKKLKVIEKYKKGRTKRFSIAPNLSDEENTTNDNANQSNRMASDQAANKTMMHRSRTEPFLPSEFKNRSFTSGFWERLSWTSRKDIGLNQFESRPASIQSRQGSVLDDVLEHATPPEREFFEALDAELEKITNFHYEKKHEADSKLAALKKQVMLIEEYGKHLVQIGPTDPYEHPKLSQFVIWMRRRVPDLSEDANAMETGDPNLPRMSPSKDEDHHNHHISYKVARSRLKKALFEFYRSLEFLRSYRALNATGFAKILKKFDKTAGWNATNLYTRKLQEYNWYRSDDLQALIDETEELYVNEFAGGHRRRGMRKLRIPEATRDYHSPVLRTGLYLGLIIPAFVRSCEIALDKSSLLRLPNLYTNLQIYACFVLPLIFSLGFAVNMMVWSKSRINYKFIFEFDPRDNLNYHQFAELPALLLLIMTYVMYVDFTEAFAPAIPSEICPLIFVVILIAIMFCPFNILYLSARKWLGIALGRILLSFCFRVEFRDFFIADELNSLSYSFWTLSYFFCAYGWHWSNLEQHCQVTKFWITPIIACLPAWWRLLQCIRRYKDSREYVHLVNAGKYLTSIWATALTGTRRIHNFPQMQAAWLAASIINSTYTALWDLKMDWGLLQVHSRYFLLRNDLVFYHWTYYVAMPVNVALRFAWIVNTVGLPLGGEVLGFIFGFLECYRRFQWNFFRLENEHLNNCGQFRAIKEIPLPFSVMEEVPSRRGSQIQLPAAEDETYPRTEDTRPVGRSNTLKNLVSRPDSTSGTFYGRRDFEAKQDSDNDDQNKPSGDSMFRRITRITSRAEESDSEEDDDDEDGARQHVE
ncbi:hypothetical protein INT43_003757 [Umbelopsis isabellina]|uniref:Xenotropic and polytropic retrovirus receptor 1 n=1 Tax=Mortierella isabellina TaxID=91625 RepID=A0A8H7PUH4_MORIS|nr:hypothetical protein INT43_003757 [Umbelopsis isabellina]